MNKILTSAALCGLLTFAASGLAAESQAVAQEQAQVQTVAQEITLRVAITGHEAGNIYKVTDEEGNVLRADLGKHGGRMLNNQPFLLTADVEQDEQGEILKLKKVAYADPAPLIEKPTAQTAPAVVEQEKVAPEEARDAAYSHELSKSQQKDFYQNNVGNIADADLAAYKKVEVTAVASEAAGTKIAFVGSAVATVAKDDVMRFWGGPGKGGHVKVAMNGAYVPLGQRSVVYGTVQEDGSVSLERLDSVG